MTKPPSKPPLTSDDLPERRSHGSSHHMGEADVLPAIATSGLAPKSFKARIDAANALSKSRQDHAATIAAWQSCIAAFPAQARLVWFVRLRIAILAKHGGVRKIHDPSAYLAEVEQLFDTLRSLCSNRPQDTAFVEAAELWIDQTRVGLFRDVNDRAGSVRALDRLLGAHPEKALFGFFLLFFRSYDTAAPGFSPSRVDEVLHIALKRWPASDLTLAGDDDASEMKRAAAADLQVCLAERQVKLGDAKGALQLLEPVLQCISANGPLLDAKSTVAEIEQLKMIAQSQRSVTKGAADPPSKPDVVPRAEECAWMVRQACPQGSDRIIFVFSGVAGQTWASHAILHSFMKGLGCHLVYLFDVEECFYLQGPDWSSSDGLAALLKRIAQDMGAQRIACMGMSAGGYAALRFGADIKAEAVIAFSPLTTPTRSHWVGTQGRMQELMTKNGEVDIDLDQRFAKMDDLPRTTICYGELVPRDKEAALLLRDFPNVTLNEAPGVNYHNSLRWYLASHQFIPLMQDLFQGQT